ncbi:GGDEF domain-containing protein [Lentibacillus cibarius]|uniref:GGDEF domain-containing protein n=1 Tax=Lentibacillus cibarius TaxID=2583219 RepID=A0A5S3QHT0_9BACI|nr:GGDEF domain-containing protein [Lentibacillus cibarius]TMN21425.1 GGDEF domain-containing protein [Lentibacillus cibarius]
MQHFAHHDSLTGLPNRRLFKKQLRKAIDHQHADGSGFAVILMDIDYFKQINDELGHDVGDAVIEEFGKRLNRVIRHDDMAARLGGDEFVILLSNVTSVNEAVAIAKEIQHTIKKPWTILGKHLHVSSSMGVAMAPEKGATVFSMLKEADNALYEAKGAGRNAVKLR